ncbi:hypothetical protein IV498_18410 [Paenarthrobacter sp. Z7-10]|uniref:hypothetical protein n=1 Tax=Paenarthrobacter sp. Z7-10 TaxID=2787635 RepID=UPI0022A9DFE8|nr:hypothetical protein [Paenarthrobacter sp. Z7-10]MCZ2405073.1 hypothetical protein [Paenarthrobacter sp. Z7-10]
MSSVSTLDITDIATDWTETVSVKNKAQKWVFAAIKEATAKFPFPILGIDSDYAEENAKPMNRAATHAIRGIVFLSSA